MALNAKKVKAPSKKSTIEPMESGTYPARLCQLIDLGLQPQDPYNGQEKGPVPMIYTTYEFLDEFLVDEDGNPDESKPRWLSEKLPFYNLGKDKARSTHRYKALDPSIVNEGDWVKVVSAPVMVTVVTQVTKSGPNAGKPYNKIGGTTAMRAKDAAKAPPLVHEPKVFSLDDPDVNVFLSLPDWLQELIKGNLEYKGSLLEKALQKQTGGSKEKQEPEKVEEVEEEDDNDEPW